MKKFTTPYSPRAYFQTRCHLLVLLVCLGVGVAGQMPESSGGWILEATTGGYQISRTAATSGSSLGRRIRRGRSRWGQSQQPARILIQPYIAQTWRGMCWRTLLLAGFGWGRGQETLSWTLLFPWLVWGWQLAGQGLGWRSQPEWRAGCWLGRQVERLLLLAGLCALLEAGFRPIAHWLTQLIKSEGSGIVLVAALGCVLCGRSDSYVALGTRRNEQGQVANYTATLCGHFDLTVAADDFFRRRLLILFLRLLEEPGHQRGSRRTREGRIPAVRQQPLAAVYGVTQPEISRWEGYWQRGDWGRLLSIRVGEVLTLELQARIVAVFAQFPWWHIDQVTDYLQAQEVRVTRRQVRQTAQESGWSQLRQELVQRYHLTKEGVRPRDEWLVGQLLAQIQRLLAIVEAAQLLTVDERVEMTDILALADEVGLKPTLPLKALPWALRLEQILFGHWEQVTDEQVRCIYCGSANVGRKSRQPRWKRYFDESGARQKVAVYRYYCHNADCDKGTFTNLPAGLVPYSPYRLQTHLLAVQMVIWARTNYRRTATALGLTSATVYRWTVACGTELLPVAALFGLVRSSGVIGIDEKYVLVPKNDKPEGAMRRWMYVSVAVDCYTYDLLHIAIYRHRNKASSQAFLLALRTKGYRPRVIVTDLWPEYAPLLAQVFPGARHHHCIFHALQAVQRHLKKVYGPDYRTTHPQAVALKMAIYHVFEARTRRTARKRFLALLDQRQAYVTQTPEAEAIFLFLERHWPNLVNGIESKTVPRTNNTAELVIRRFDQHYQNFCGFDSLDSARLFVAVFEKFYRFTPFSQDAQAHLRGKCPLELAGYDISQMPAAAISAGWSPDWSLSAENAFVPNL
jgi:transposase-like protein